MRRLVHTTAAITMLALPICQAQGAESTTLFPIAGQQPPATGSTATKPTAQPDASTPANTAPAATTDTATQPAPTKGAAATTTETTGQPAPSAQPDETAQPEDEASQPDQTQPSEEDTTQSSGPMTATDKIVAHFMALDTDQDDGVSFDEYMAMVQQRAQDRFATMDVNGDGQVTAEEYRKFWKERKAQWYRLRR